VRERAILFKFQLFSQYLIMSYSVYMFRHFMQKVLATELFILTH
jgi:hypothetical protein